MNQNKLKNVVPIVFAVNNGYAPYLYISIVSLIKYAQEEVQYQIYILYTGLENRHIERLEGLGTDHIQIMCQNVKDSINGFQIKDSLHFTIEVCFRLFIAELFPQYSRIVYIDSDTLFRADVAELYSCNLKGKTVGAIHEVVTTESQNYYEKHLDIAAKDGFNSGILVIDTEKFRENRIKEKCIEWLIKDSKREKRKYIFPDQDVLNLALKGQVCFLESKWNFQCQYLWRLDLVFPEYRRRYIHDSKDAKIIHYAGSQKPWSRPELEKADLFWKVARESIYYEEILFGNLESKEKEKTIFLNYLFPFSMIPPKSKVILYGAGNVGKVLYKQNKIINYVDIVLWVDKNYRNLTDRIDTVYGLEDLQKYPLLYDYILIAIGDRRIFNQIRQSLINYGIPENKIIWDDYRRA